MHKRYFSLVSFLEKRWAWRCWVDLSRIASLFLTACILPPPFRQSFMEMRGPCTMPSHHYYHDMREHNGDHLIKHCNAWETSCQHLANMDAEAKISISFWFISMLGRWVLIHSPRNRTTECWMKKTWPHTRKTSENIFMGVSCFWKWAAMWKLESLR